MWFSEKALVFVDTRSAALAVYREGFSGPRLERFGSERFASRASGGDLFSDVLALSSRERRETASLESARTSEKRSPPLARDANRSEPKRSRRGPEKPSR